MRAMSYHKLKNIAATGDSFDDAVTELLQNMGGKYKMKEVSLGSDFGLMGNTNQLHASPATGKYKENE